MLLVDRYIARLMVWPVAATLLVAAMLLLLERMQRLFDLVASDGGPVWLVWSMLANTVPGYLSLGLTIALLMGVLLTFRRLALSSELDVLRSSGLSYLRLLRVPYAFAVALAAANLAVIGFIQPHARYENETLRFALESGALGAAVRPGDFRAVGHGAVLRTEAVAPDGRTLRGVFLQSRDKQGRHLAVSAREAQVLATPDGDGLVFRLHDGVLVRLGGAGGSPGVLSFTSYDLHLPLPAIGSFRARGTGKAEEFTLPELGRRRADARLDPVRRRQADAEFEFRLVEIATMFVVPLLALALGVPPKRSGSALGVFLGLLVLVTWFKVDQYGAEAVAAGRAGAMIALWLPLAALAGVAGFMAFHLDRRPGGQPLGVLQGGWQRLVSALRRTRRHL